MSSPPRGHAAAQAPGQPPPADRSSSRGGWKDGHGESAEASTRHGESAEQASMMVPGELGRVGVTPREVRRPEKPWPGACPNDGPNVLGWSGEWNAETGVSPRLGRSGEWNAETGVSPR